MSVTHPSDVLPVDVIGPCPDCLRFSQPPLGYNGPRRSYQTRCSAKLNEGSVVLVPRRKKFSIYSKPRKPTKPQETLPSSNPIIYVEASGNTTVLTEEQQIALRNVSQIQVIDNYYDDDVGLSEVTLAFYTDEEVPNPNYDREMERYKGQYAQYREDLKWWNAEKKKYDEELKAKKEKQERETLAKLLKKYGPEA